MPLEVLDVLDAAGREVIDDRDRAALAQERLGQV